MDELKLLHINNRITNMKRQFDKLLKRTSDFPNHSKVEIYRVKMKELIIGIQEAETNKKLILLGAAKENPEGVNIDVPTKAFGLKPQVPAQ